MNENKNAVNVIAGTKRNWNANKFLNLMVHATGKEKKKNASSLNWPTACFLPVLAYGCLDYFEVVTLIHS